MTRHVIPLGGTVWSKIATLYDALTTNTLVLYIGMTPKKVLNPDPIINALPQKKAL